MVHQPSAGFQGQATDIEIQAKEILDLSRMEIRDMKRVLRREEQRSSLLEEEMKKMFDNNAVQLEKSIRNEAMRTIDEFKKQVFEEVQEHDREKEMAKQEELEELRVHEELEKERRRDMMREKKRRNGRGKKRKKRQRRVTAVSASLPSVGCPSLMPGTRELEDPVLS